MSTYWIISDEQFIVLTSAPSIKKSQNSKEKVQRKKNCK